MLIVYDRVTGEVYDNTGTNSASPDGPPDKSAYMNTDQLGKNRGDLRLLRFNDDTDSELVRLLLTNKHRVDVKTKTVVIEGPYVEDPPTPEPVVEDTMTERIQALYDNPNTSVAAREVAAALLGLNGS